MHERGAPHLVDPSKLLASAARLYGDEMERLWGEVAPVPAERVRALAGGEQLGDFRVAYTPGHASHHVAYLHEPSGRAFTGDVAGVRIAEGAVLAPTPPPDIDLQAWRTSLDTVAGWRPLSLALTHFGERRDVDAHLDALREELERARAARGRARRGGLLRRDPRARRGLRRGVHGRGVRAGDAARAELPGPGALPRAPRRRAEPGGRSEPLRSAQASPQPGAASNSSTSRARQ